MELQFSQYQHQSTPVPSTDMAVTLFCSNVHKHRPSWSPTWRLSTWGVSDIIWCVLVGLSPMHRCFSGLVCQPLTSSTLISGRVARLDSGVPVHDALRQMVDTYEGRKAMASRRRPSGRPRSIWLNSVHGDANVLLLSTLWRSEFTRVTERRTIHADYATTTTTMMMRMEDVRHVKNGR